MRPIINTLYLLALIAILSGCVSSATPSVAQQPTAVPTASIAPTVLAATPTDVPLPSATAASPTVVSQQPTATAQPQPSSAPSTATSTIRQTDWPATLASDPKLRSEAGPTGDQRPYYTVAEADVPIGGHPLLDDVLYVDMDGDGVEEAVIALDSGGTAGNIGFLVYRQATPAPRLVAWMGGYKQWARIENGQLVTSDALYTGWEGNCCPSAFRHTIYGLQGDQLQILSYRNEAQPGGEVPTAQYFYSLIDQKRLQEAYDLLSIAYQQANPYETWAAGFATTSKVEATVTQGASPEIVNVDLTATDTDASGQQQVRRFRGTWEVRFDTAAGSWKLSNPQIKVAE